MNNLLYLAILLLVIWVVARVLGFFAGMLLNLIWVVAIILLIVWLLKKVF